MRHLMNAVAVCLNKDTRIEVFQAPKQRPTVWLGDSEAYLCCNDVESARALYEAVRQVVDFYEPFGQPDDEPDATLSGEAMGGTDAPTMNRPWEGENS